MKIESYFAKSIVFRIMNLGALLEKSINAELLKHDLSYFQALILISIFAEGQSEIHLKDLAAYFPISKGGLSQALSSLENKKLISRKSSNDRRSSVLVLTSEGKALAPKLIGAIESIEQRLEDQCSIQLIDQLENLTRITVR